MIDRLKDKNINASELKLLLLLDYVAQHGDNRYDITWFAEVLNCHVTTIIRNGDSLQLKGYIEKDKKRFKRLK